MKITKLEHSGIIFEKNGQKIVCDPVEFTVTLPDLQNVAAVILTHKHGDHYQKDHLAKILAANPEAIVFTTSDTAPEIPGAHIVHAGDTATVADFSLKFFGQNHAPIVPGVIPCENIGVVIDERFVNPGDSFDIPDSSQPAVLFVANAAPWCKINEAMEYVKAVKPQIVIPFHNALLSELGESINNNWLNAACKEAGSELKNLAIGESIEID